MLFFGCAIIAGFSTSLTMHNATMLPANAATGDIVDSISIPAFTNCPDSYTTDGTEYEYAADAIGNESDTLYSATGINKTGTIRGNKTALGGNFNLRNKTSKEGYYISKLVLEVSGGKLKVTEPNRTALFIGNSEFTIEASAPVGSTLVEHGLTEPQVSSVTWINNDTSASYFMLYSLATYQTCTCAKLEVTWSLKNVDPTAPNIVINENAPKLNIGETFQFSATKTNADDATIVWNSEDETIATVNQNGLVTAVGSGTTKVFAKIVVDEKEYVASKGVTVLYSEPDYIETNVAGVMAAENNKNVAYKLTATIKSFGKTVGGKKDQYGNMILVDETNPEQTLTVYGSSFNKEALTFDSLTNSYTWKTQYDFLENPNSASLLVEDKIEIVAIRADYKGSIQINALILNIIDDSNEVLDAFVNNYLHPEISYDDNSDTGACLGTDGYYAKAKEAFNNLTARQRNKFVSDEVYAKPYARLLAWARANGETFDASNSLVSASNFNIPTFESNSYVIIVSMVAIISVSMISLIIVLKRKKSIK